MVKAPVAAVEKAGDATRHPLNDLPYRALVLASVNKQDVPTYFVAGSDAAASGAKKALMIAHRTHGSRCFYCDSAIAKDDAQVTIDHAEPTAASGTNTLHNLLMACRDCNLAKGRQSIEAYRPEAGREWLNALLLQVQDRLNRINPPSPPPPSPAAASGP